MLRVVMCRVVPRQSTHTLFARAFSSSSPSSSTLSSVGFIGLGTMGQGMSRRLLEGNHNLCVYNRSIDKSKELQTQFGKDRVHVATSAAEVIQRSTTIILMLSTPQACDAVYRGPNGVLSAPSLAGKSLIDCATLEPQDMQALSAEVVKRGGRFLEAPVSGSKGPAQAGQLIFLASGNKVPTYFSISI